MQVLRIDSLPEGPLEAACAFHAQWLTRAQRLLGFPCSADEALLIVYPPADHTHRAWRLAVVQGLARQAAPARVNAVAGQDAAAIAAAVHYLAAAPGLTGQYLTLDDGGAGAVIQPVA